MIRAIECFLFCPVECAPRSHFVFFLFCFSVLRPHRRPTPLRCSAQRLASDRRSLHSLRTLTPHIIMSTKKSTAAAAAAAAATPAAATPSPVDPAQVGAQTQMVAMRRDGCARPVLLLSLAAGIPLHSNFCLLFRAGEERPAGSVLAPVVRVCRGLVQAAARGRGGHSARHRTQEDPA